MTNQRTLSTVITFTEGSLNRRSSMWSVQAVLYTHTITVKKTSKPINRHPTHDTLSQPARERGESRIVVYREHFRLLLSNPNTLLRNRLILELPSLQGFRSGEVSNFKAEYANFERGLIGVMDTKKHCLFWNPMRKTVAKHLDQYMELTGIRKGILFRALPGAPHTGRKPGSKTKGEGLSIKHIEVIWANECIDTGIPPMAPRTGRAFFAVWWIRIKHKPIAYLKVQMRHTTVQHTEDYWNKILDGDDLMDEFQDADSEDNGVEFSQGQPSPFSLACKRFDGCPLAAPGCRCRMFQPQIKEEQTWNKK